MSKRERDRLAIMAGVKRKELTLVQASDLLEVCYRQTKRIWQRYQDQGDAGLVHRRRGQPSPRCKPDAVRVAVLELSGQPVRRPGHDCRPTGWPRTADAVWPSDTPVGREVDLGSEPASQRASGTDERCAARPVGAADAPAPEGCPGSAPPSFQRSLLGRLRFGPPVRAGKTLHS